MKPSSIAFSIAILCGLCASNAGAQVLGPKLKAHKRPIQTVLVMPARVTLTKSSLSGGHGMAEEEARAACLLYSPVRDELELRGVKTLSPPDDRAAVSAIWNGFETIRPQLEKRPGAVGKGRITIGDRLAGYAPEEAEYVLFVHGTGLVLTAGKQLTELPITGLVGHRSATFTGYLTFVDAKSGQVAAVCSYTLDDYPIWFWSTGDLRAHIRESMRKLPFHYSADFANAVYISSITAKPK